MYVIIYSQKAEEDLAKLRRNEPAAFKKAVKLLNELIMLPVNNNKPDFDYMEQYMYNIEHELINKYINIKSV